MQEDPALMQDLSGSYMPSSAPLNLEPSQPQARESKGLQPKSYKAAAEENLEHTHSKPTKVNGTHKSTSSTGAFASSQSVDDPDSTHRRADGVKSSIANLYGDSILEREYYDSDVSLTSVRPPKGYKAALQQDELERKSSTAPKTDATSVEKQDSTKLVSGREAGQRWHRSAIRFAPLNVPLQRRLQTLTVLFHGLSIAGLLAVFLFLAAIPVLWPILVPYLIYCLLSNAGASGELSHRSERVRRSKYWSLFASYFPARLHRSQELSPTRKYIFGYHPHGIISNGAFAAFGTEALGFSQLFPGITNTLLTLDSNFRIPLYREYALKLGLGSVDRSSCENLLSKGGPNGEGMGRAITIVVGGARESLDAQPGKMRLVLKRRKGFVKLAVREGADLVPVLGFGENELFEQFKADDHPYIHKFQLAVKKFLGFTIPLFFARGIFNYDVGLMPYRRPLNVVVGRPIPVEQDRTPSEEIVNELHEKYVAELVRLWELHKDRFAQGRMEELEFVE